MATALSLSPLFRQTVGFDHFNELFDALSNDQESHKTYPPYDIVKYGENNYQIVMAVAGFNQSDITITVEDGNLKVAGKHSEAKPADDAPKTSYLHQGIAKRGFKRNFRLADNLKVENAKLENGLLSIDLKQEIPEEKKPQLIPINNESAQ